MMFNSEESAVLIAPLVKKNSEEVGVEHFRDAISDENSDWCRIIEPAWAEIVGILAENHPKTILLWGIFASMIQATYVVGFQNGKRERERGC